MLPSAWKRNDRKARIIILTFSAVVFAAVMALGRVQWKVNLGFDVHLFATLNATINSIVTFLLVIALVSVKLKNYNLHRNLMITAMILSILFLVSYICHHLFAGETKFGGSGNVKFIYYFLLGTHIPLAGLSLPFILFTAYRGLTGDYARHKKLARITWPLWLYVAVTGVIVYWMISPYYQN